MAIRVVVSFVLLLATVGCGDDGGLTSPTAPTTPVVVAPSDFVGRVAMPLNVKSRDNNRPVQEVTMTIVAGPRSGESVETNHNGRYIIPDFDGDEIRVRLEKAGHETKEAIVHRTRSTTLMDGKPLGYAGPQKTPGTILIGLEWPSGIRRVLREMTIITDTLLVLGNRAQHWYGNGVVEVNDLNNLRAMAHELCHAHQHFLLAPRGSNSGFNEVDWEATLEGKAYIRARQADWDDPEVGKNQYDLLVEDFGSPLEGAAETCARWWDVGDRPRYTRAWLQDHAPNRARWAQEWLTRRP